MNREANRKSDLLGTKETPFVILMHGVSKAGKTSLSKGLCNDIFKNPYGITLKRYSSDDNKKLMGIKKVVDRGGIEHAKSYKMLLDQLEKSLSEGNSVILDTVSKDRKWRDQVYDICAEHSARLFIVRCVCEDAEELDRRMDSRLVEEQEAGELLWSNLDDSEFEAKITRPQHIEDVLADKFPEKIPVGVLVIDTFRKHMNPFRLENSELGSFLASKFLEIAKKLD